MNAVDRQVRLGVYQAFAETGRRPAAKALAATISLPEPDVRASLRRLAQAHLLSLDDDGEIWMAHPFSGVPTKYSVDIHGLTYTGNCAWDVIAIATIIDGAADISIECEATQEHYPLRVSPDGIEGEGVVHHVVPPRRFWDDIGFT